MNGACATCGASVLAEGLTAEGDYVRIFRCDSWDTEQGRKSVACRKLEEHELPSVTKVQFRFSTRNTRRALSQEEYRELVDRVSAAVSEYGLCDVSIEQMVPPDYEYPPIPGRIVQP